LLRVATRINDSSAAKRRLLLAVQSLDARYREIQKLVELRAIEGVVLAGPLHFHEFPFRAHDDVHVDVGANVFVVIEIESRLPSTIPTLIAATRA
jgi:hypothetical protein